MKSRLFTTIFDDPETDNAKRFLRHFREALNLNRDDMETCVVAFPEIKLTRTADSEREAVSNLSARLGIDRSVLEHTLSIVGFFADAMVSDAIPVDDHNSWADDLQELGWIDNTSRPVFETFLEQVASLSSVLQFQQRQRGAIGGVLPKFNEMGCTVELRPIRKGVFHWGQSVEDFRPEILGTVMVASIHIGVDEGPVQAFYFQVDDTDIDNIIDSLRAAKKEMTALREFLKLDET